jgi:MOSC domain-containing protein YiiM
MSTGEQVVDSRSVGNPERFRTLDQLERDLAALPGAPRATGRLTLVVRRVNDGRREILPRVRLAPNVGVPGDSWGRRPNPHNDAQLAVMQQDVAELIANGQPLTLFGDQLFLDLDLSREALATGTRLRIGAAILAVTPKPHNGCHKFQARFGDGALAFVKKPELRHRNLRGIYLCVVEAGDVAVGDAIEVLGLP